MSSNGGVMVSMLASSVVKCGFEPRLDPTKDYKIGMCCLYLCPSGATCLSAAITIAKKVLILILVQTEPHHHFIENQLVLAMINLKNWR